MFLNAGDTQLSIGHSLWSWKFPQDLANALNEMHAARGKAAINCKINNSNFGPLHQTKDLHASPASIGRIKKHKEHKKHKTPQCEYTEIPEPFSAYSAFSAFLLQTIRAESKDSTVQCGPGATRTATCSRGREKPKKDHLRKSY